MNFLKGLFIIISSLVLIFLLLAFFGPKRYEVKREKIMKAPKEVIWEQISILPNWENWSPWKEMEANAIYSYTGKNGEVGAIQSWEGDTVGKGALIIDDLDLLTGNLEYSLSFLEPFEMESKGQMILQETPEGVKLSWYDRGEFSFFQRPFMIFMNLDEMIGNDFEKGLNKLDSITFEIYKDKQNEILLAMKVEETIFYGDFIGIRETIPISKAMDSLYFKEKFTDLHMLYTKNQWQTSQPPVSICYKWNEVDSITDMAFVFAAPVGIDSVETNYSFIKLDTAKAYLINYYGTYQGLYNAHIRMESYLKENKIDISKMKVAVEQYVTDPTTTSNPSEILTRVYYLFPF